MGSEMCIRDSYRNEDWNEYVVIANGARIQTWVNGQPIEDLETPDIESREGFIGLQVHSIKKEQRTVQGSVAKYSHQGNRSNGVNERFGT